MVIVSIDFLILLIPTALDSARVYGQLTESKEHVNTEDVRRSYIILYLPAPHSSLVTLKCPEL